MSLMKNKLEWAKIFASQLPFDLITLRDFPVIQNLQNLIRLFLIIRRKIFFCSFKKTLGTQEKFMTTGLQT